MWAFLQDVLINSLEDNTKKKKKKSPFFQKVNYFNKFCQLLIVDMVYGPYFQRWLGDYI